MALRSAARLLASPGKSVGLWHCINTAFEGFIGAIHLLSPDKIYRGNDRGQEKLLSKFAGSMMLAFAMLSWMARKDQKSDGGKAIMKGMIFYHAVATGLNLLFGCGIDGTHDPFRDRFHAVVHASICLGTLATLSC